MQLKEETLDILKNFSAINSGIWINKGEVLSTTDKNKNIIGTAITENEFPTSFGIYDVATLLSIFSLHKSAPELEFQEHNLVVSGLGGRSKIKYRYCAEEMLVVPPKRQITLPSEDIVFSLNEEDYLWVCNAAKILESPNVAVRSDGDKVYLVTFDLKNNSAHDDALEIDAQATGKTYNIIFDFSLWNKIMTGSYDVAIHASGLNDKDAIAIAKFKHRTKKLEYIMLVHEASTYNS